MMIWAGILICLVNSAMFSGMTLGLFGLSRLRLEVQATAGNDDAKRVLGLRRDANRLLATLLWGNVGVNVLLTLLTDSVLTGLSAFCFSTFVITCFGEIMPQAFFSRHALRVGALLVPVVRIYSLVLYPVAKPTAFLLDIWLGKEGIHYFTEDELKIMIDRHVSSSSSDVDSVEGRGAVNFLKMDDFHIETEGTPVDEESILVLPEENGTPIFPKFKDKPKDPFLQRVQVSKKKWVIITNDRGKPVLVLDADEFLRNVLYEKKDKSPYLYCHRPIVVDKPGVKLGEVLRRFRVYPEHAEDHVIDDDLILYWNGQKRIITGADLLGKLLKGIVIRHPD
jgi:metal transporter CNNM